MVEIWSHLPLSTMMDPISLVTLCINITINTDTTIYREIDKNLDDLVIDQTSLSNLLQRISSPRKQESVTL